MLLDNSAVRINLEFNRNCLDVWNIHRPRHPCVSVDIRRTAGAAKSTLTITNVNLAWKMADDDVNGDSDDVQQEKSQKKAAKYDSGAADLEKVTDYAEEKEISSSDGFSCVSTRLSWVT